MNDNRKQLQTSQSNDNSYSQSNDNYMYMYYSQSNDNSYSQSNEQLLPNANQMIIITVNQTMSNVISTLK